MKTLGLVTIVLVLECALPRLGISRVPVTYLRNLVTRADWILIGEVFAIEDTKDQNEHKAPVKIAKIRPLVFIKGTGEPEFSVKFMPTRSEEPDFVLEERFLLFLRKTAQGPQVLVGHLGALMVKNKMVSTWEISGEPETQSLDTIIEKIKNILKK